MKLYGMFGPTCSGKTALAIQLAKKHNTEIISCDSRQIFKELKIGVARPSDEELFEVKHHFIAQKSILEPYSAGEFEKEALQKINELSTKFETLVLVGGSTLYIDALLNGLDELPQIPVDIKESLELEFQKNGLKSLQKQLWNLDPEFSKIVDIQNPRRIIRALELMLASGKKMAELNKKEPKERPFESESYWINLPREELYTRINSRCDEMLKQGLLTEVESLLEHQTLPALSTVGYSEFFEYFNQQLTLEEATEKFKQHSRNYAKRQVTWFSKRFEEMK